MLNAFADSLFIVYYLYHSFVVSYSLIHISTSPILTKIHLTEPAES
jgi:hypothetical protein